MRIGILGGTFNPIHSGHLINGQFIMEEFKLDRIILMPLKKPVHKTEDETISSHNRLEMCRVAVKDADNLVVSSMEIDREKPSFTIFTINDMMKKYPEDELYLIIGADSFNNFKTWKDYRDILKKVSLIVMKRNGDMELDKEIFSLSANIFIANNPLIEISSSLIRSRIKENKNIEFLVHHSVYKYIEEHKLYIN